MGPAIGIILLVVIVGLGGYGWIYSSMDHWSPRSGDSLVPGAKITDVSTNRYNKYKFRTVIRYDDGFAFTAFDTKTKPGVIRSTISVDYDIRQKMIARAESKRFELLEKAGKMSEHD